MKDDLRYTPSDCFETFPFPDGWETDPTLEAAGESYYQFRANLMVRNDEGLTKTYNRFHDPYENDPQIATLRELHAAMDRAVLDAYGWTDIPTDCEFLLDYEIDEKEWGTRKKALPLPLARRRPQRSPRPAAGTERRTGRGGAPCRPCPPNRSALTMRGGSSVGQGIRRGRAFGGRSRRADRRPAEVSRRVLQPGRGCTHHTGPSMAPPSPGPPDADIHRPGGEPGNHKGCPYLPRRRHGLPDSTAVRVAKATQILPLAEPS